MELALDRHNDGTEFKKVNKIIKDKYGRPIGTAAYNPIQDKRVHKVEDDDVYKTAMPANAIASNLFYQVNQYGKRLLLFNAIIDLRTNGTQIKEGDSFIHMPNGKKRRRETTKGW